MKHLRSAFTLIISLVFIVAACRRNQSQSPSTSERALSLAATTFPTQEAPHPAFVVTADQVRKAFDDGELKGEKKQGITVGEEASINITAKDQLGRLENLKFSILFLTPLEQAKGDGYSFGLVAKQRTPADRKEFEDRSVSSITKRSNEVTLRVFLQQPTNEDATIPSISFKLLNVNGNQVFPLSQPTSYVAAGRDIIGAVGLAEDGQPVTFPVFAGSSPHLTAKMKKMTLIVVVDEKETSVEFALK